jgi:uncharacterized protein
MQKNALSWFEIPADDFERARRFYSTIFAYDMPVMPMGDSTIGILPYDDAGGGVGGAINKQKTAKPSPHGTLVYLNAGDDLTVVLGRVAGANGRVVMPKTMVTPEIGFIALFEDTEGNIVGLHSPR